MNQLLSIAHINDARLKSILNRIPGEELLKLSEHGYCPNLEKSNFDLIRVCGLTTEDIDDLSERTWEGRPEEKRKYPPDQFTLFLVWLMWYFINRNDVRGFKSVLIYHMIRQYRNLFKFKYFREFSNPDAFIFALNRLSKSHLFSREGSIPNAISYLSNALAQKYEQGIKNWDLDAISKFITESRSRLNQSFRTFANSYYNIIKTPEQPGIPSDEEQGDQVIVFSPNTPDRLAYEVTNLICVKGYKYHQAIAEAKKITKISLSMATALVDELSNGTTSTRYFDHLQYILTLLLTNPALTRPLSGIVDIVTRLMRIKRTTKPVCFKKEIQNLTSALVENSGHNQESLTHQTQFRISQFLAYYIAMVLKNVGESGPIPPHSNSQIS